MVKRVACFITGGYTESGALKIFLKKINPYINFEQVCPNNVRKRKGVVPQKLTREVSGLTGASLVDYMYDRLRKEKNRFQGYDAVLLEDDLDGRYFCFRREGDNESKIVDKTEIFLKRKEEIDHQVRTFLEKDEAFPVIQLYASPEIESWFLTDWDQSFGRIYGPEVVGCLSQNENSFFTNRFRKYVSEEILGEYRYCIEKYGYFNATYRKLSDELIHGLRGNFKVRMHELDNPIANGISENKDLYYSKNLHGDLMLREISPEQVAKTATLFYRDGYELLRNL